MALQKPQDFFIELNRKLPEILAFLNQQISSCGFPIYTSLDIRDAGYKIAVVDVNLFPAGFNILTENDKDRAAKRMSEYFAAKLMTAAPWRITVVPEANTRNLGYLENLAGIISILERAQCEVKLLWPGEPIPKPWTVKSKSGTELTYLPAEEALEGAQALLLNHDLSGGVPKVIENSPLPTFPSKQLGWYRRRKSTHQEIVESLLTKIERNFDWFDPWYFSAMSKKVAPVNFNSEEGLHHVADEVSEIMQDLRKQFELRGIKEAPRAFVKNDAGTYGMGVLSVKSREDILEGGRRLRKKMSVGKESVPISQVIVQEAVPTALLYQDENSKKHIAGEPVIYMVNGLPIGGFVRIHEELGDEARFQSLNQPGSLLEPLECPKNPGQMTRPFPSVRGKNLCQQIDPRQSYGFLARLHAIAAGMEECAT